MRPTRYGVALLVAGAILLPATSARAQDSAYPGAGLTAGGRAEAPAAAPCGGSRAAPDPSAYAYGRLDCVPAANPGSTSAQQSCVSPYQGYSGLLYSDHSPYHAPGGEAYSYAGYGSAY